MVNNIQGTSSCFLDKICAKKRAQLCCCLKLAPSHTAQLSFLLPICPYCWNVKTCGRHRAPKHSAQLSFCFCQNVKKTTTRLNILKILPQAYEEKQRKTTNWPKLVCVVNNIQQPSIWFLDKRSAKQSAQLVCCSKSHKANHTAQLSFCLKFAPKVKKLNLVQKTVRNYPVLLGS